MGDVLAGNAPRARRKNEAETKNCLVFLSSSGYVPRERSVANLIGRLPCRGDRDRAALTGRRRSRKNARGKPDAASGPGGGGIRTRDPCVGNEAHVSGKRET